MAFQRSAWQGTHSEYIESKPRDNVSQQSSPLWNGPCTIRSEQRNREYEVSGNQTYRSERSAKPKKGITVINIKEGVVKKSVDPENFKTITDGERRPDISNRQVNEGKTSSKKTRDTVVSIDLRSGKEFIPQNTSQSKETYSSQCRDLPLAGNPGDDNVVFSIQDSDGSSQSED